MSADFVTLDTAFTTAPRSIFTIAVPLDSTLRTDYGGSFEKPGYAIGRIDTIDHGPAEGILGLGVTLAAFWSVQFAYGIGYIGYGGEQAYAELIGAVVHDIEYGDLSLIRAVRSESESARPLARLSVLAYPNPTASEVEVTVLTRAGGRFSVELVDLHGRTLRREDGYSGPNSLWRVRWSLEFSGLPAGTYFVRVVDERGKTEQTALTVVG